jgi:hypothetical protein
MRRPCTVWTSAAVILRPRITHVVSCSGPASFTDGVEIERSGLSAQVKNAASDPTRADCLLESELSEIHTQTDAIPPVIIGSNDEMSL